MTTTNHTPPTDEEMERWERRCDAKYDPRGGTNEQAVPRLIAEVRRLREEAESLRLDRDRWDWFFGPTEKGHSLAAYMQGVAERWTPDQWRAWADTAMEREQEKDGV